MLGRVTHAPSFPKARTLGALLGLGALTRVQSPIIVKSHESEVSPGGTVFPLLPLRTFGNIAADPSRCLVDPLVAHEALL